MFVSPQHSEVGAVTPTMAAFGDRVSKEEMKVTWGHRVS